MSSFNEVKIKIKDADIIRLLLEFMHERRLITSELAIERETGISNVDTSTGIGQSLCLIRQLIVNGQFTNVLRFINNECSLFDADQARQCLLRHQYLELVHSLPRHSNGSAEHRKLQSDIANISYELQQIGCNQTDCNHPFQHGGYEEESEFSADENRLACYEQLLSCLSADSAQASAVASRDTQSNSQNTMNGCNTCRSDVLRPMVSKNCRLVQLLVKGLLYEECINYCQTCSLASADVVDYQPKSFPLLTNSKLINNDLALYSWLYTLPKEIFSTDFSRRTLSVHFESLPGVDSIAFSASTIMGSGDITDGGNMKDRDRCYHSQSAEASRFAVDERDNRNSSCNSPASFQLPPHSQQLENNLSSSMNPAVKTVNDDVIMPIFDSRLRTCSDKTNEQSADNRATRLSRKVPHRITDVHNLSPIMSSHINDREIPVTRSHYSRLAHINDPQAIRAVSIHPTGRFLAIGSNSQILRICEWPTCDEFIQFPSRPESSPPFSKHLKVVAQVPKYHTGFIFCLAWNPEGNLLASGSNDKCSKLISFNSDLTASDCSPLGTCDYVESLQGTVRDVCFLQADNDHTPGCSTLLSAGNGECQIIATDINVKQVVNRFVGGHQSLVFSLTALSRNEFVSGSQDGRICLWDARSNSSNRRPMRCVEVDSSAVASVHSCNPISIIGVYRYLASGHGNGIVRLWDLRNFASCANSDNQLPSLSSAAHKARIRSVRFKPHYNIPSQSCSGAEDSPPFTNGSSQQRSLSVLSASDDKCLSLTQFLISNSSKDNCQSWPVAKHMAKAVTVRWHPTQDSFVSTSADKSCAVWTAIASPSSDSPILSSHTPTTISNGDF